MKKAALNRVATVDEVGRVASNTHCAREWFIPLDNLILEALSSCQYCAAISVATQLVGPLLL